MPPRIANYERVGIDVRRLRLGASQSAPRGCWGHSFDDDGGPPCPSQGGQIVGPLPREAHRRSSRVDALWTRIEARKSANRSRRGHRGANAGWSPSLQVSAVFRAVTQASASGGKNAEDYAEGSRGRWFKSLSDLTGRPQRNTGLRQSPLWASVPNGLLAAVAIESDVRLERPESRGPRFHFNPRRPT